MKIVAVSQRVDTFLDRGEHRDALDQRLCSWLIEGGYLPLPIPSMLNEKSNINSANPINSPMKTWWNKVHPDALVLSGGNDLGEIPERDDLEHQLLDWAKEQKIPVLGICRGMQMMGFWTGAKLEKITGHVQTYHKVSGEITGEVNSYHNFAFVDSPSGFTVLARSEDDRIEAMQHQSLPWEGWMWHPERENPFKANDIKRLKKLFGE